MSNKIVCIGSVVTIFDLDLEEKSTYKIVSKRTRAENEISCDSILGKALMGKQKFQKVVVPVEDKYIVKILEIDNEGVHKEFEKILSAKEKRIVKEKQDLGGAKNETIRRNIFFCFQGKQFENEFLGGYIFTRIDNIHHHKRLRSVKEGDIIFHGNMQGILAVSVVEGKCFIGKRPLNHYLATDKKEEGLMVKTKYQLLKKPIITYEYKEEIVRLQGDHEGKGYPFNKNGKGNEGYLFNLNKGVVKFFMEEILKRNPLMIEKDYVKELLDKRFLRMKLCPKCELNWIQDNENSCSVCEKQELSLSHTAKDNERKKHPAVYFQEEFIFTNEQVFYRGKRGYQAYNSQGQKVGIVFMNDDKRTPAYENCELCMYEAYHNRYGEWHRIKSNGGRIKWSKLCSILQSNKQHKVFID